MSVCRVGVVGAGNIAQRHARVLGGFNDVRVIGVCDVVPAAAQRLADTAGAHVYRDVRSLLDAELDAVYVCVPPFAHGTIERAVVTAGLPMFVEKPIAADLETAVEIARLVAGRGVLTAVGHHWRYLHVVDEARRLLTGRAVRLVTGAWLDQVPPVRWWPHRDRSGGPIVEQAAHVLDLARLLAGEVTEVYAVGNGAPPPIDGADVDGATAATLWFTSGAVGTLAMTCALRWKHRARVDVYADGLALSVGEDGLTVRDGTGQHHLDGDPDGARVAVDRAFIDAVRGVGDDVRVPYDQALHTHRLAVAIARSAATGDVVRVAEGTPTHG